MRRGALFLFAALLAGAPMRADQPVTVRLAWVDTPPAEVAATLLARDATASAKVVEIAVSSNASSILLPAGQWFVSASSPGYWSEPALVSVADQSVEVTLRLYRSAQLRGKVNVPTSSKATTIDVHFNPTEASSRQPRGSATCPVVNSQLDCELPAGSHDLAFRIPGHATLYRWAVDFRAKPFVDVGKLTFRRGATLSGRVEAGVDLEGVEVILRNAMASERNDALRERHSVTRTVTRPNKRGFFAFDVLPGSYIVSAKSKELVSDERQVTVVEGREAILKDPLVLERLGTLVVNVQLPPEGAAMPWKLSVIRFDADGHPADERVMRVPPDGICRFENQLSGSYGVELKIRDSVWATQSAHLSGDATIDMAVQVTKVRGSIQLGENPLQADLLFISKDDGFRIPARSKADGTFLVFLPNATRPVQEVEIRSAQPWVRRVLKEVLLEQDDDDVATLDLRLPENRIDGIVVDERARGITEGVIDITAPGGFFQQYEMSDGTFTIRGLEPGKYSLTASTVEGESEEPLVVEISGEGESRHDVVLTVAAISQLDGSVASAFGPVIGASVYIDPVNRPHPIIGTIPVDTTGAFTFRVPRQTRDIVVGVTAPGFSFRMMRMPVPPAKLDLAVDQHGGSLTIDGRVGARAEPFRPYLMHNGAILSGYTAAYLARGRLLANADERVHFEIPSAEEGTYSLCLLSEQEERSVRLGARPPQSRCVSGVLGRHGALTLRAPDLTRPAS